MPDDDLVAAEPEPEAGKEWVALLDGDGVLVAYDTTGKLEGVEVPANCDLRIGEYRWDGKTFQPILIPPPAETMPPPDAMRAIAAAVMAVADRKPIPKLSADWARWYLSTIDGQG